MTPTRRKRAAGDPVATLTLFRDEDSETPHPGPDEVKKALEVIYPSESFTVEHRAMVIDGATHVVYEVYDAPQRSSKGL